MATHCKIKGLTVTTTVWVRDSSLAPQMYPPKPKVKFRWWDEVIATIVSVVVTAGLFALSVAVHRW